jgi:hypothetical protein
MQETIQAINRLQSNGTIGQYAIGGAVGATFYLEPLATEDLDIFVVPPALAGSSLITLTPNYESLTESGCVIDGEHIVIAGWPVQFLPASSPLIEEALERAVMIELDGTPTRVMTAEHLAAIALNTGRAKDFARIVQFIEQNAVDDSALEDILKRHGLEAKWTKFQQRYLDRA